MPIRAANPEDASEICRIYNPYVTDTWVTFEEQPVSVDGMRLRISEVTRSFDWIVLEEEGRLLGYAYANQWRPRPAYRYSVEGTVYLDQRAVRSGHGTRLYSALIERQRQRGLHCIMGGVALPNAASVALHEKLGFKKVAHLAEIGWKLGAWRDVGYWQLQL